MATCAAIIDTELPGNAGSDSVDILPIMKGCEKPMRDALVHHSGDGIFSIRHGPWKLIKGLGSGGFSKPTHLEPQPGGPIGQLYNIAEDLGEQHNRWKDHPNIVIELSKLLAEIIAAPDL